MERIYKKKYKKLKKEYDILNHNYIGLVGIDVNQQHKINQLEEKIEELKNKILNTK